MNSVMRRESFGGTGDVVPDAIGGMVLRNDQGQVLANFTQSFFIEVKAVNAASNTFFGLEFGRPLGVRSSRGQLYGLLDIAGFSAAGMSPFTSPATSSPATILALTTSNTDFSKQMLELATAMNVAVWQAKAYAVQDPVSGKWQIGFYPAELLNQDIQQQYQARGTMLTNPLPNGTGVGTLGRTLNAPPAVINPDPTFQP